MCKWRKNFIISISGIFFLWSCAKQIKPGQQMDCLPSEIKSTDVVSAVLVSSGPKGDVVKKLTVQEKLRELNARCRNGKLVDEAGREIYFYRRIGCWGAPPPDYKEMMQKQAEELETLRKQYTVIELTCNPSGRLRQ